MDERADILPEGLSQFWLIDENYERIEQLGEVDNVRRSGVKPHRSSKIDDETIAKYDSLPIKEKIFKKGGKDEY